MGMFGTKGFSWFERKEGQGNILDPLGLLSGKKEQEATDKVFGMINPVYAVAHPRDGMSADQQAGKFLDPAGFFGKKENSSALGQSRLSMNLDKFNSDPDNQFSFSAQPLVNSAATQVNLNEQNNPGSRSSYAGLLDRKFY